jgi:hypothetical protein
VGSGTVPNRGATPTSPLSAPEGGRGRRGGSCALINEGSVDATEGGPRVTTYFCDGLREVTVVNGVVRLEFHRLEAVQRGQNRELQPVVEFTVALPPPMPTKSPNFS